MTEAKERLEGLDLLRTLCFVPILIHHLAWFVWASHLEAIPSPQTTIAEAMNAIARAGVFSGFGLVFLTSFLMGYGRGTRLNDRWPFLLVGAIVFRLADLYRDGVQGHLFEWDIYPFLLVSYFTVEVWIRISQNPRSLRLMTIVGAIFLMLPFWTWAGGASSWLSEALFGLCPQDYGEWPIFPWVGLVLLGFSWGRLRVLGVNLVPRISPRLGRVFAGLACLSILGTFREYNQTPLGDAWACYVFRRPVFVFWSHFVVFAFALEVLSRPKFRLSWISRLPWNQDFGFWYVAHYGCAAIVVFLMQRAGLLNLRSQVEFALGITVLTTWLLWKLKKRISK